MRRLYESEFEIGDKVLYDNSVPCEIIGTASDGTYDIEPIDHDQYWNHMRSVSVDKLMKMEEDSQLSESWQDKYDDFEDFEYEITSAIENDLEYDPIPSEIEVDDFITNLGISMEAEQSIIDISVIESDYYVNDVTFDEDGDPDVATVEFRIRYHIKTKDRASAQEIAYAFDDIPINLLEYGLSGHYYTRGTIEIDEWSVTEMGKGKNAVSLYIQGGMDLNVYEFM